MKLPASGLRPTSPAMTEVGTLVIPVPARIAKFAVVPSGGLVAATALAVNVSGRTQASANSPIALRVLKSGMLFLPQWSFAAGTHTERPAPACSRGRNVVE